MEEGAGCFVLLRLSMWLFITTRRQALFKRLRAARQKTAEKTGGMADTKTERRRRDDRGFSDQSAVCRDLNPPFCIKHLVWRGSVSTAHNFSLKNWNAKITILMCKKMNRTGVLGNGNAAFGIGKTTQEWAEVKQAVPCSGNMAQERQTMRTIRHKQAQTEANTEKRRQDGKGNKDQKRICDIVLLVSLRSSSSQRFTSLRCRRGDAWNMEQRCFSSGCY